MIEPKYTKDRWVSTQYGYEKYSINDLKGTEVCSTWDYGIVNLLKKAPEMYDLLESIAEANRGLECGSLVDDIDKLLSEARPPRRFKLAGEN